MEREGEGGRGAVITDRDCDAPRELLLMADAHLWSVSGGGGGGAAREKLGSVTSPDIHDAPIL